MAKERVVPLEASLADEGALWFPNLLEEDPMMILPVTFTFLLCANIGVSHLLTAAAPHRLQQSLFFNNIFYYRCKHAINQPQLVPNVSLQMP